MHPEVRASDTEREDVARLLRDHCAAGRITVEELDERVAAALGARSVAELDRLIADLPVTAPRRPRQRRRVFWPGIAAFHEVRRLRAPVPRAHAEALQAMVPRMALQGFHLIDDVPPRRLVFEAPGRLRVTVLFHAAADGGTEVSAFGEAPRAVRKAFATLAD